jgi:hypothetical protein
MMMHSRLLSSRRHIASAALVAALAMVNVPSAFAQLDPLLNLKDPTWDPNKAGRINVIIAIDSSERMQRDANGVYYDPVSYPHSAANVAVESLFGVPGLGAGNTYRRAVLNEVDQALPNAGTSITAVPYTGTDSVAYSGFYDRTRINIAANAIIRGIIENFDQKVARFGIVDMRHTNRDANYRATPPIGTSAAPNESVQLSDAAFSLNNETGVNPVYYMNRYKPAGNNATAAVINNTGQNAFPGFAGVPAQGIPAVAAVPNVASTALVPVGPTNFESSAQLAMAPFQNGWIKAYGNDVAGNVDAPLKYLLDDAWTEAKRAIDFDYSSDHPVNCRNTIVILVTGGGEGNTVPGWNATDPETRALAFRNVSHGQNVPIYVIAIAPTGNVANLKNIAANSHGQYFEIDANSSTATINGVAQSWGAGGINARPLGYFPSAGVYASYPVADAVAAFNWAISDGVRTWTYAALGPGQMVPPANPANGVQTEIQTSSPIVATVSLTGRKDIHGNPLPNTDVMARDSTPIPQRSNVLITTSYLMPGFQGQLRAFRQYKPAATADMSNALGWTFVEDGTPLWVSSLPAAGSRNIFTTDQNGNMMAFTGANAATIMPFLNLWAGAGVGDATTLINYVRSQPLGAILSSTPAVLSPPSLDPPPDADYPSFVTNYATRRTIIMVGANDGMLHAFDARSGLEVWAFIPFNLLPKLKALAEGQPVSYFQHFVDSSPKLSDVKVGGNWATYMIFGEGLGGTFYHTMDVTLSNDGSPTDDTPARLLGMYSETNIIPLAWNFPSYQHFDYTYNMQVNSGLSYIMGSSTYGKQLYGELNGAATAVEKTIGYTWSDPAVGQINDNTSPFVALTGSGFFPSQLQTATRGGVVAGRTFYMFLMDNGQVLGSQDVGSTGYHDTQDDCTIGAYQTAIVSTCSYLKNGLQADVVALGNNGDKFIGKALAADMNGKIWQFSFDLSGGTPFICVAACKNGGAWQNRFPVAWSAYTLLEGLSVPGALTPIFNGMSVVPLGGWNMQILFAQGSDKLPTWCEIVTSIPMDSRGCSTNNWGTWGGGSIKYYVVSLYDQNSRNNMPASLFAYQFHTQTSNEEGERPTGSPAVAGYTFFIATNQFNSSAPCSVFNGNLYAFTFQATAAYDTNLSGGLDAADSPRIKQIVGATTTGAFTIDRHVAFGVGNTIELFGDPNGFNNGIGAAGIRMLSWREIR